MNFDLSGKVALVTGASSGLGEHFAKVLASSGASLVLAARRMQKLESLADSLRTKQQACLPVSMDVTDSTSVREAIIQVRECKYA